MARKLAELDDLSMGDLSSIIGRGPVSDLSWLSVDEEEYRAKSAVPHQNLDMIPELTEYLSMNKDGVPERVPYRDVQLININNLGQPKPTFDDIKSLINKTAHYVYKGTPESSIYEKLNAEYGSRVIDAYKDRISTVIQESGLLGNVYVKAEHFPKCVDGKKSIDFVKRYASRALYVIQDDKCSGCVKNKNGRCASLGGRLVDEVSYDQSLLDHYAPDLIQTGRLASDNSDVKSALKRSFLTPEAKPNRETGISLWTQSKVAQTPVTDEQIQEYLKRSSARPIEVSLEFLAASKKLMLGKTSSEYLVQSKDPQIQRLASYEGLLGSYIFDMDALGGCAKTAHFLKSKGIEKGLYLIRRNATCSYCQCAKGGPCEKLQKSFKIVANLPELTVEDYERVVTDKIAQNVLNPEQGMEALRRFVGADKSVQFKVFKRTASLVQPLSERRDYGYKPEVAHTSVSAPKEMASVDEISAFISSKMNDGVYGADLGRFASLRYTQDELRRFHTSRPHIAAGDGIQGYYYLDPTVYKDYGRGCKIGSSKFRGRGAENVRLASACSGCSKQTSPGWCAAYAKPLLASVDAKIASAYSKKVRLPIASVTPEIDISDRYELSSELVMDMDKPRRKWDPQI